MPWSRAAIFALLKQLSFESEFATLDADAIQCALALLTSSTIRGPNKVFVLSDRYGSCGARLSQVDLPCAASALVTRLGLRTGLLKFEYSSAPVGDSHSTALHRTDLLYV
ncbi:TPA: hypothetical protein ACH3X2_005206 [Trebouxia sp. C0005]